MTRFRKIATGGLAALTIAATLAATATPADAWGRRWGGWHHHRVGAGPIIAGTIGGLALGALAAGAYNDYGARCVARQRIYNRWGDFIGYRRVLVPCD